MKNSFGRKALVQAVMGGAFCMAALPASAGSTLNYFDLPVDFNSVACATYGDFISCSAEYLNYVTFGDVDGTGKTTYVVQSSEGVLKPALVVFTGDAGNFENTDIVPTNADNAYMPVGGSGSVVEYGTDTKAGDKTSPPTIDPVESVIGEVSGAVGSTPPTAWDIGISELLSYLTVDGVRRDMLIMYDNNQAGNETQLILASALVCVRDAQGVLTDKCFELVDQNGYDNYDPNTSVYDFNTSLTYNSPLHKTLVASDGNAATQDLSAVVSHGNLCVDPDSKQVTSFDTACVGNEILINNNLGTQQTEFFVSIPELNASLEALLADGYDVFSFRFNFNGNTNGFENIFLLAGNITEVPEPSSIALLGLGLLGVVFASRRRREK